MVTDQLATLEQRFAEGDAAALKDIHDTFAGRMFGVALRILNDRDLAADAVQQALMQAWKAAHTYDPGRPLEPWLFSVTRRAAIDVYHRHRSREQAVSVESIEPDIHPAVDGASAEQVWLTWKVRSAVERLSSSDQAIIKRVYFEDMTHRETADELGIPIGTVKSRLFRAHRKLTAALGHLKGTA